MIQIIFEFILDQVRNSQDSRAVFRYFHSWILKFWVKSIDYDVKRIVSISEYVTHLYSNYQID